MKPVLMLHELALVFTIIVGIIYAIKKKKGTNGKKLKQAHFIGGIVTIVALIIYLIQDSFSILGYNIYAILLVLVFGLMLLKKKSLLLHIGLVVVAIVWLVLVHII